MYYKYFTHYSSINVQTTHIEQAFMLMYHIYIYELSNEMSVPITTKVVSSNRVHGEVYSIQQYVIKFVSDLRQVGGFLRVLRFPPPIKLAAMI